MSGRRPLNPWKIVFVPTAVVTALVFGACFGWWLLGMIIAHEWLFAAAGAAPGIAWAAWMVRDLRRSDFEKKDPTGD